MKKLFFALAIIVALTSCKKEDVVEFTPTDVTGTTVVSGTLTKNVLISVNGAWSATGKIPVENVTVTIKVNRNQLYPGSNAKGADIYTAKTNAQGFYTVNVKTNATGVQATISVPAFVSTLDTLLNGVVRTGKPANFPGTTTTPNLTMGVAHTASHDFVGAVLTNVPSDLEIGTAIIRGFVRKNIVRYEEITAGNFIVMGGGENVPVSGVTVTLFFDKDPNTNQIRQYTATTDASGAYTFNLATVPSGTTGFNQNANIIIPDYQSTRDTLKVFLSAADQTVTGPAGVYNSATTTQNGLYNTEVRTNVTLNYSSFSANQ
jgi:hypothetical protein